MQSKHAEGLEEEQRPKLETRKAENLRKGIEKELE